MAEDANPDDTTTVAEPDIAALVAAEVERVTGGLRKKNGELLTKLKAADDRAKAFGDLDPDDVIAKLDALEDLEAGGSKDKSGEDTAAKAAIAAAQRKFEREKARLERENVELKEALDNSQSQGRNFLLNSALDSAIGEVRIADPYREAVRTLQRDKVAALLADEPEVTPETVNRLASETLRAFAGSEQGKHFVQATMNSGGGAQGSAPGGKATGAGAKPVHQMTELEKVQFVDEHGLDAWNQALIASRAAPANVNGAG